jgi:hypothetical protein
MTVGGETTAGTVGMAAGEAVVVVGGIKIGRADELDEPVASLAATVVLVDAGMSEDDLLCCERLSIFGETDRTVTGSTTGSSSPSTLLKFVVATFREGLRAATDENDKFEVLRPWLTREAGTSETPLRVSATFGALLVPPDLAGAGVPFFFKKSWALGELMLSPQEAQDR